MNNLGFLSKSLFPPHILSTVDRITNLRNAMAHNIDTEMVDDQFRDCINVLSTIAAELFVECVVSKEKWTKMLEDLEAKSGKEVEEEEEDLQMLEEKLTRKKDEIKKVMKQS